MTMAEEKAHNRLVKARRRAKKHGKGVKQVDGERRMTKDLAERLKIKKEKPSGRRTRGTSTPRSRPGDNYSPHG